MGHGARARQRAALYPLREVRRSLSELLRLRYACSQDSKQLYFIQRNVVPAALARFDLATRKLQTLKQITPGDSVAGVTTCASPRWDVRIQLNREQVDCTSSKDFARTAMKSGGFAPALK